MATIRILIVEDEEPLSLLLRYNLESEGFRVTTVARGDEAFGLGVFEGLYNLCRGDALLALEAIHVEEPHLRQFTTADALGQIDSAVTPGQRRNLRAQPFATGRAEPRRDEDPRPRLPAGRGVPCRRRQPRVQ